MRNADAAARVPADLIEAGLNEPAGCMVLWGLWCLLRPWVSCAPMGMAVNGSSPGAAGAGIDV